MALNLIELLESGKIKPKDQRSDAQYWIKEEFGSFCIEPKQNRVFVHTGINYRFIYPRQELMKKLDIFSVPLETQSTNLVIKLKEFSLKKDLETIKKFEKLK
mgnify:CR=1 FL=1